MAPQLRAPFVLPWIVLLALHGAAALLAILAPERLLGPALLLVLLGLLCWIATYRQARRLASAHKQAEEEIQRLNHDHERQVEARTAELRASEAHFRALVHHFPDGSVFLLNREGRYLVADGELIARNGFTPDQLEGKTPREAGVPPEVVALIDYSLQQVFAGEEVNFEYSFAGQTLQNHMVPIRDQSGAIVSALSVTRDLSALRNAEEQRLSLQRQLFEAQRMESIGMLAGGIAHDFNNLITAILGHAELLRLDLPPASPLAESVQAIIDGSRRAAELTAQMLAYAGKGRLQLGLTDLNKLIEELDGVIRPSLPPACALTYRLAEQLPPIEADPNQLRQMLSNLLTNAVEAIGEGGSITVSTAVVALDTRHLASLTSGIDARPGRYVQLTVLDDGHGMDAATRARIFEPFFSTRFTGRGLGLAAVQGIVRSHGGTLEVRSAPGAGTTFQIWLPLALEAEPPPNTPLPAPEPGGVVLVIDDEASVREVTARMLGRLGITSVTSADGTAGLVALDAGIARLECVIVDLTMPGLPGDAVARLIAERHPGTRVFLMSGYSAEEIARSYSDLPVAGVLQKPFSLLALRQLLGR